jgi:hypothetical protein
MSRRLLPVGVAVLLLAPTGLAQEPPAPAPAAAPQSEPAPEPTPEQAFQNDVHRTAGLTCETCHTGSAPGVYEPIDRTRIAPLCARCHSDAAYMRQFAESPRVDQHAQYLTSTHGTQMAAGETRVATCSDCHRAHGVRSAQDAESPVAPRNVAATCSRCHADPDRMEPFDHYGNPQEDWQTSVHATALLEGGDMSAPTCSTCHSAHGSKPEEAASLQMVCAQCHVREADLYLKSTKKAIFEEAEEPGCITCHTNHAVEAPSDAWVGLEDPAVCAVCHDDEVAGAEDIRTSGAALGRLAGAIDNARTVLTRAEVAGMLVDEGLLTLHRAEEQQVLARLNVHAFTAAPLVDLVEKGVAAAAEAEQMGHDALAELQLRRRGLAVATLFIVGFLITLWIKIRRLPPIEG